MTSLTWNQITDSLYSKLSIPSGLEKLSTLEAALSYAAAGWYVLPVTMQTKHAGSYLGKGWPEKTSRDPATIKNWFKDSTLALALHVGKSGALAIDVDDPAKLSLLLRRVLSDSLVPFQSTRIQGDPLRGHYLFSIPKHLKFGNSVGQLGTGFGDVRGENGIIIVSPSRHSNPNGYYCWQRTGELPPLPDSLIAKLPTLNIQRANCVDLKEASQFIERHNQERMPALLDFRLKCVMEYAPRSGGRHTFFQRMSCIVLRDAVCGFYPASLALNQLQELFNVYKPIEEQTHREFVGMALWAIGQTESMPIEEIGLHAYEYAPHLFEETMEWVRNHAN